MKLKISKGDTVEVITGDYKGRKGAVLALDDLRMRVKVQGVSLQKDFRPKRDGGLTEVEGFIDYSNIKLVEKAKKDAKKKTKAKSK